ncbi:MAG: hypothetical protein Ct9H90mP30_0270 [Actinomycetota bacterium]|nr:MAG: hypothetical protein Ct9H90mP30_0270 [Actinomycetota bacterium]
MEQLVKYKSKWAPFEGAYVEITEGLSGEELVLVKNLMNTSGVSKTQFKCCQ